MNDQIQELRKAFLAKLEKVANTCDLEELKVHYLGKKGPIQELMQTLKQLLPEEKKELGRQINDLKEEITGELEKRFPLLLEKEEELRLKNEVIDVTLPGRERKVGHKHIITRTLDEIIDILSSLGFSVTLGPDIDSDYYNFESLNIPENHPARDMQDTFYLSDHMLLRSHTSNVQVRVMEKQKPPIRVQAPGRAFRNENISARSHVFFHQIEAFYVDKGVTFPDLFATIDQFIEKLFGRKMETLFRPSYFPFVEPGLEIDIRCFACDKKGCSLCKHTTWIEIGGAGMIHREVLKNCGIDPEEYSGFAWGLGIERLAQIKHGISDIRLFTENDLRFLDQFTAQV